MMLGRFNLYVQSIVFLLFNKRAKFRTIEIIGFVIFMIWYSCLINYIPGTGNKFLFILISNASTFILHVQITISHFAMSTEVRGEDEEFVKHQLRTTMDVECSPWLDWFHGGLQFQVIHHMFPRMPRCNYRKARETILKFCTENNLEYKRYSFFTGNAVVINHLASVSKLIK